MKANFKMASTDFWEIVDSLKINTDGLMATIVFGYDIDLYCKRHSMQKRHLLSRIEKVRESLET